jgi:predicted GNAT family acetyltransferase
MNLKVADAPDRHRFEAWLDGKLAGFASYIVRDEVIVFTHTEVDPAFEGHGVGGALARTALDEAAARSVRVRALCPFIAGWIAGHPEYQHLTVPADGSSNAQ